MNQQQLYYQVIIPKWENSFILSKKTSPKYWLWKDRDKLPKKHQEECLKVPFPHAGKLYCANNKGERFLKNTKKVGKPNIWIINGQQLYSGTMHPLIRAKITDYFHKYFEEYIKSQLNPEDLEDQLLSISCDIYEIKRSHIPDVDNLWPLIKWFQDALQTSNTIPDDSPDYIIESGRKRYIWVEKEEDRKLVFTINITT